MVQPRITYADVQLRMPPSRIISISDQVLSQQVSGETVLLDLASEQYFGLDEVGSRFWELLVEGRTFESIISLMSAEFDVSSVQLEQDLEELIAQLSTAGLVSMGPTDIS